MALITCPECQGQMSDTAAACPHCGWSKAVVAQRAAMAAKQVQGVEGQRLVNRSTWLMAIGFVLMFAGCGIARVAESSVPAFAGIGLGLAVLVAAAVIGQIGRAKQGRIL